MTQLTITPAALAHTRPLTPAATLAPTVIGLDVALVLSGVAGDGWAEHINTRTLRGEARLAYLLAELQSFYRAADFVALEGAAFSRGAQRGHDELAAIRWMVRVDLHKRGIPCAVIPPNNRIQYALGTTYPRHPETRRKLTPEECKGAVRATATARYGVEFEGRARYDKADAYVLRAMAMHHLGRPLADVPDTHAAALTGVPWPERNDQ